jgi:predicted nucleic acid-binding protein
MAEDQVVLSDSSPLTGLAAAEAFHVLRRLFGEISVTASVQREVTKQKHLPGAAELTEGIHDGWIHRIRDPRGGISLATLDAGEATTLYAAVRLGPGCLVLMDDAAARAEAQALGVMVTGTAGVLLLAHRRRLIRSVRPLFEKLFAARFRVSPGVINKILEEAGED